MINELNQSFYAIIPANVRYDKELPPNAKLLYGEITALCNVKGYCWAKNEYFAQLYDVSKTSISKWISLLIQKGYITSEIIYYENSKQIKDRYLKIINDPIEKKLNTPIEEKLKDNNTNINNINNNIFKDIIDYLNNTCNKHYKYNISKTNKLINTRLKEGFTVDDFKNVIDIKASQWLNTEMEQYLRPETLFGTKFESYLNQDKKSKIKEDDLI